jgi:SpoVK/Ycf46/Vps4 family AAA+-type ATPase
MSDLERWQESNSRQLSAALSNLRQRLEGAAPRQSTAAPALDVAHSSPQPDELPSALVMLGDCLGLSHFERNILLLCAAMEFDTRVPGLCARAHDDLNKPFPTFALALALFDEPSWDALSPERPLRYWRLVEISQPGAQPLTSSALRADERIVHYLKGLNYLDDRLSSFVTPLEIDPRSAELAPSQHVLVDSIVRQCGKPADAGSWPVAQLLGVDPISKQLVAHHAAAKLKRTLCRIPADLLPGTAADLETLGRLWQRESQLLPLALYLDAEETDPAGHAGSSVMSRFLAQVDGFCFLSAREAVARPGRPHIAFDISKPTSVEQQSAWTENLGPMVQDAPARLAAQFNLNLPSIRQLAQRARTEVESTSASLAEKTWEICRQSERPRLDSLAQRLELKMTWDDLVLPTTKMRLLREIAAQVAQRNKVYEEWGFARKMNRGFGISALFAGDSGCGKTMAAEVIANELRLNLYRIDLSAVVNKYIGETEKNLRRLFDAAEEGGSILFFDEADALFGKRSEVKDSHDRYANIEINYLLQRLESYRGLAILATNMKSALDEAFLRRLRFVVNFPFPGAEDRRRLWEKVFLQQNLARNLPAPPLDGLDYERLARLNLTGGHIHSVALNACFMAADLNSSVSMPLVLQAARAEFMKLDRPVNEADFRCADRPPVSASSDRRNGEVVLA